MTDHKALMRRYVEEVLNQGDQAAGERLLAPTFVCHMSDGRTVDRATYLRTVMGGRAVLDLRFSTEDIIVENDRAALRYRLTGTQRGEWQGIPPTGKPVDIVSICTYRLAGDQIVEKWLLLDQLGLLQQLGAVPKAAPAGR